MEDNDFDFDGSLDLPDSYEGIAEHENFMQWEKDTQKTAPHASGKRAEGRTSKHSVTELFRKPLKGWRLGDMMYK